MLHYWYFPKKRNYLFIVKFPKILKNYLHWTILLAVNTKLCPLPISQFFQYTPLRSRFQDFVNWVHQWGTSLWSLIKSYRINVHIQNLWFLHLRCYNQIILRAKYCGAKCHGGQFWIRERSSKLKEFKLLFFWWDFG